jgi:hypothetical protein
LEQIIKTHENLGLFSSIEQYFLNRSLLLSKRATLLDKPNRSQQEEQLLDKELHTLYSEIIEWLFLSCNWQEDTTIVQVMNGISMCDDYDTFMSAYINTYTIYDRTPNIGDDSQQLTDAVDNTQYRIVQMLTFDPQTAAINPISFYELLSCHLLYLLLYAFIEVPDTSTGVHKSALDKLLTHSLGMLIVDSVSDRITQELQNTGIIKIQHQYIQRILQNYTTHLKNIPLHSPAHISKTQEFMDLHQLDSSYHFFLRGFHMSQNERATLKFNEFFKKLENFQDMPPHTKSSATHVLDSIKAAILKITESYPEGPTTKYVVPILYDASVIRCIFSNQIFQEMLKKNIPESEKLLQIFLN